MDSNPENWTTWLIAAALCQGGFALDTTDLQVERRGDRKLIRLPEDRLAWFPMTAEAAKAMQTENRVLSLVRHRCSFAVPETLFTSSEGWIVRSIVPGTVDAYAFAALLKADPLLRRRAAAFLGGALAELHSGVHHQDVAGWLSTEPSWPLPRATIRDALPRVPEDADLMGRIECLLTAYDGEFGGSAGRSLIHADLGLHNLAFDGGTGEINGIFDFGSAVWADRHFDFRYFVFAAVPDALLDEAMTVYEASTGLALSRPRILLCNAVGAVSFLADRAGHAPEKVVAGRTLEQDLAWTRWALQRAGF